MACLDTTVFLDLRGRSGKKRRALAQETIKELVEAGETLVTTRVNVAELLVGVELSNDPVRERQAVIDSLADMEILEFDEPSALAFARIRADLQRRGRLAGDLDVMIAAIATANGESLVTANAKHFLNIPGLTVIAYGP